VPLTKVLPQVCVDLVKRVIRIVDEIFEVMTQVDHGLTNVSQFDSAEPVISINDAN
jgi:hypothetical protein